MFVITFISILLALLDTYTPLMLLNDFPTQITRRGRRRSRGHHSESGPSERINTWRFYDFENRVSTSRESLGNGGDFQTRSADDRVNTAC